MNYALRTLAFATALLPALSPIVALGADLAAPPSLLPPIPSVGAHYSAIPAPLPSITLVGSNGQFIGLKLDDAIGMALAQNTGLALSEADRRIAGYQVVADRGPYDLKFTVAPSFTESTVPALSPFQAGPGGGPTTSLSTGLSSGLLLNTLEGGKFSVSASANRVASDSTSNSYNPYFMTQVAVQMTQPLGTGRFSEDRRDLYLAAVNAKSQEAQTYITASTTITNVIDAYWDLYAAWRNLGIQELALAQAKIQSASNDRLVRRGTAAPIDIVESNTQVDVDQDTVFSALQNVASLQNRLKGLILGNPLSPLWAASLVPTSPITVVPAEPELKTLVVTGLVQRPEFISIAAAQRTAAIRGAFARDESRPQIDLQVGYTRTGFAGEPGNISANPIFGALNPIYSSINSLISQSNTARPAGSAALAPISPVAFTNPSGTIGRFGTSWNSLLKNTYPTYTAQLNFAVPFRNDRGRGDAAIAREEAHEAQLQEVQAIQMLIAEAGNALQSFDAARQRLSSAHAARLAADEVLASEGRKFVVGRSTTFLVLQRQIEAAADQGRELQAQTDLNKAIAEIDRVNGDVFVHHGIHLKLPARAMINQRLRAAGFEPVATHNP